jgi:hypothetical protein
VSRVLRGSWENVSRNDLISGGTKPGCSTMTMHQPMLPSWLDSFWPIKTWLWCHVLPTCPTFHPATFLISKTESEI